MTEEENSQTIEKEEQPRSKLDIANEAAERLERANAEMRENIKRQEELMAERVISGMAEAGQAPVPPKEETPQEYAARIARGELRDGEGKYA